MFTATITREQLDDIIDAAELYETDDTADDDPDADVVEVRENYSGRGMYGSKCLGFVVSSQGAAFKLAVAMGSVLGADEAREIAGRARTDSMGRDMIVYFPGVTLAYAADPANPTDAELAAAIQRSLDNGSLIDAGDWMASHAAELGR